MERGDAVPIVLFNFGFDEFGHRFVYCRACFGTSFARRNFGEFNMHKCYSIRDGICVTSV